MDKQADLESIFVVSNEAIGFFSNRFLFSIEKISPKESTQFSNRSFFLFLKLPMTRRLRVAVSLINYNIHRVGSPQVAALTLSVNQSCHMFSNGR